MVFIVFPVFHMISVKRNNHIVFLGVIVLAVSLVSGLSAAPVIIDTDLENRNIEAKISYYVDRSCNLTIEEVSSPVFQSRFTGKGHEGLTFGYSRDVIWIRLETDNPAKNDVPWLLEYGYPHIDNISIYIPSGSGYSAIHTGDRTNFNTRPMEYRNFIFPLVERPGKRTYYLSLSSTGSIPVRLNARSLFAFNESITRELMIMYILYGIFIGLAFYNTFIYFSVRDKAYVYLGLLLVVYILTSMVQYGFAFQLLWPDAPVFANYMNPFSIFISCYFSLLFTRNFLNTMEYIPIMDRVLIGFMAVSLMSLVFVFFFDYHFMTQLSMWLMALIMVLYLIVSVMMLFKGSRTARYYFSSWIIMIIGVIFKILSIFGVIPYSEMITWGYHAGSGFMVILLSLGIADRMNIIRNERENALKSLKEADEKYKTLVENAHEGIIMVIDEIVVYVNKSMMKMTGFSENDFVSHHLSGFFPESPSGRERVLSRYRERMAGNDVEPQYEAEMLTSRGESIGVIISAAPITVQGRRGVVATITDISEIKRAHEVIKQQFHEIQTQYDEVEAVNQELKLAHAEMAQINETLARETEKLSITLKSIGEGVITVDNSGRIDIMNRAAERITGYAYLDAADRHVSEILHVENSELETLLKGFNIGMFQKSGNFGLGKDIVLIDKKGLRKSILPIFSEISNSRDEVIGAIFVLNDITQRKKMEEEIFKTSKIESLGVFAGGIAHDFNNILTAIVGNISLVMLDMDKREKHYKYLSDAEKMTGRAADLTRQLLTFSRGGAPVKRTASVRDLLRDTVDFVLSGSSVKADFDIPDELWNSDFDEGQISQVIQNLVINAVQAMPGGGIVHVSAVNVENDDGGLSPLNASRYVKITIRDEGPGIPPENMSKIFDPFFTTKPGGNGLGLSICYSVVRKHDGHISVVSEGGGGAVFEVLLPASSGAVRPQEKPVVETAFTGKVLFMDDEKIIQDVGERMLKRLGMDVEIAGDGVRALDLYERAKKKGAPFDLIIMDLTIPGGMGGRDAISRIREIDGEIKVVASSGYSNDPVMSNYRDYGFDAVIKKPYTLDQMAELVQGLLPRGQMDSSRSSM